MSGATKSNQLRFGEFVADLTSGELFKHGVKVPLQDKPYQILALLLSSAQTTCLAAGDHPNRMAGYVY